MTYYYPNRMGRIILTAMSEVLGQDATKEVIGAAGLPQYQEQFPLNDLELAFPFEYVAQLQAASEGIYGVEQGKVINRKIGRTCLTTGLQQFNPLLGIADLPARLMPLGLKMNIGFDMFAMVFNRFTDQVVRLGDDSLGYLWIIDRCPVCWGRSTDYPCCDLAVGILEEAIMWATGGRVFEVEQISCVAMGHENCTIRIGKRPAR